MTTLFDVLVQTARLLRFTQQGVATGGSTTTLADSNNKMPDDFYNGGILFFISDKTGTPLDGFAVEITDYANLTGTFTFATQSAALVAGVKYLAISKHYNLNALVAGLNMALADIGPVLLHNETLTGVSEQTQYTLPTGVTDVRRVEVASNTSEPYGWVRRQDWIIENGEIEFAQEPGAGMTIRLWHMAPISEIIAAFGNLKTITISNEINVARLVWTVAYYVVTHRSQNLENDDPKLAEFAKTAGQMMILMARKYPVRNVSKDPYLARW